MKNHLSYDSADRVKLVNGPFEDVKKGFICEPVVSLVKICQSWEEIQL